MTGPQKCAVIRAGRAAEGATGITYGRAVSAATVGARGLCMELATIPPGAQAKAHLHREQESAAYIISGELVLWFGTGLEESVMAGPGDFVYIPEGVPHLPMNRSHTEPVVAILTRTDPNEQESVVPLPDLDRLAHIAGSSVRG